MEEFHKTHKETSFGWVWALERLLAWARRVSAARTSEGGCVGLSRGARYLTPR